MQMYQVTANNIQYWPLVTLEVVQTITKELTDRGYSVTYTPACPSAAEVNAAINAVQPIPRNQDLRKLGLQTVTFG